MNNVQGKDSRLLVSCVILGDLVLMNSLFCLLYNVWPALHLGPVYSGNYWEMAAFNSLCYLISTYNHGVVLHKRKIRRMHIVGKVFRNCLKFGAVSVAFIALAGYESLSTRFLILFYVLAFAVILLWRFGSYQMLRGLRERGMNQLQCVFVGSGKNMRELFKEMSEKEAGYHVTGYFDFAPDEKMSQLAAYLGTPDGVVEWLKTHKVDNIYCSLPSKDAEAIMPVIKWCERSFIHFFSVPNVRSYLHRRMWFETVGDVPVLSLHNEPLNRLDNRIVKRAFDLLMSGLFLLLVFPFVFLIAGGIIKITSPGPIFFRQKRNGINGKEFWCYKFRSMKVNKDADKVQATKNDPRKTKFGNFMRKTNIDELPQLINVFLGDMSLVGPRPHMLKHTEEYSALIDNYMVRHLVKPGITGWAQVTGFRGETEELYQMEGRVQADIWYMEHWSFLLDLLIIYKTFANVIIGEEKAY